MASDGAENLRTRRTGCPIRKPRLTTGNASGMLNRARNS